MIDKMRLYVASSWRNPIYPRVIEFLRTLPDLEIYDFRNPPGRTGFSWASIDRNWVEWTIPQYIAALEHPLAKAGFKSDMDALEEAHMCIMVLPCGRSAHLEMGWAIGAQKKSCIYMPHKQEAELMYKMSDAIVASLPELESFIRTELAVRQREEDICKLPSSVAYGAHYIVCTENGKSKFLKRAESTEILDADEFMAQCKDGFLSNGYESIYDDGRITAWKKQIPLSELPRCRFCNNNHEPQACVQSTGTIIKP